MVVKLWIVTKYCKLHIQAAEMKLRRLAGLKDGLRSSDIQEKLRVVSLQLQVDTNQPRCFRDPVRMTHGCVPTDGHPHPEGDPGQSRDPH